MRLIIIFLFSIIIFSCSKSKTAVPKDIIPVKTMTDILWDNLAADELVNARYPVDTGTKKFDTSVVLYQQIAKVHGTNQQQFKKSMQYYEGRPDLLQIIFDTLQSRTTSVVIPPTKDSLKRK